MAALSAAIAATAAVAGGVAANSQANAAKDAASAQQQAANQATQLQREQYYDQRALLAPSITAGSEARARQMLMEGYSPDEVKSYLSSTASAVNSGGANSVMSDADLRARYPSLYRDFSGGDTVYGTRYNNFTDYLNASGVSTNNPNPSSANPAGGAGGGGNYDWVDNYQYAPSSPSYQFRLDQGSRALQRSAAANGNLFSGQTGQALQDYGQNIASTEFENDYRRLGQLAGDGTDATGTTVNVAGQYGNNAASNALAAGNARASGYTGAGNAWGDFWSNTVPGAIGTTYGIGKSSGWFGK